MTTFIVVSGYTYINNSFNTNKKSGYFIINHKKNVLPLVFNFYTTFFKNKKRRTYSSSLHNFFISYTIITIDKYKSSPFYVQFMSFFAQFVSQKNMQVFFTVLAYFTILYHLTIWNQVISSPFLVRICTFLICFWN